MIYDIISAAEYLKTTPRHIRRLITERRIEHLKVGKLIRFTQSQLDLFIERNTRKAVER